jgi:hypothetical protein
MTLLNNINTLISLMEKVEKDSDFNIDLRVQAVEIQVALLKFKVLLNIE